jgi:hypothetical protein
MRSNFPPVALLFIILMGSGCEKIQEDDLECIGAADAVWSELRKCHSPQIGRDIARGSRHEYTCGHIHSWWWLGVWG